MAKSTLEKSLSLVFVFPLFVLLSVASSKSSKEAEAEALLKWKASLQIKNQSSLTSWTSPLNNATSLEPCTWPGISCKAGSISKISVTYSGMVGTLHEFSFSSFHNLAYLNLSSNELHGSIPPQIGQLTKLIYLDLSYNQLSGNIPAEIGLLTHLGVLGLGFNLLNGSITPEIGKLKSLKELYLDNNNLEGPIPTSLGNLSNLTYLNVYNNMLTGTLHEFPFSSFHNLPYVNLSSNKLYGSIPPQISNLTKVIDLDLSNNQFSGNIPAEIGLLTHLEVLRLGYNRLNGSIAPEIGKLKSIKDLSLKSNTLEGPIPTSLGNLSNMTHLDLCNNLLTGSVPSTFGNLEKLVRISLSKNHIFGYIPWEIGNLKSLETVSLYTTNLSGPIPKSLGSLTKLTHLLLYSNNLCGPIPKELGNLVSLVFLELDKNQLNGSVPASLGKLKSLGEMRLNDNRLSGFIPPEFGSITSLWHLDLSSNIFSHPIPKELGNLSNLVYLSLRNNQLSQEIPITLMKLRNLSWLDLSNNLLMGHISSSISDLGHLENLNLSHNRLSGGIPESISDMPILFSIDVSYNELQGPVPHSKAIEDVGYEALRGNKKLCGNIQGLQSCGIDLKYYKKGPKIPFLVILLPLLGVLLLVFAITGIFIIRRRKRKEDPQAEESNANDKQLSWISSAFDGRIMYEEIMQATNDFDVTYRIGRGGFGIVYKAVLPSVGIVAVKKFHSSVDGEHAFKKEFLNEINALLEIKHRNIVKLHGFCSCAQHSFLVYEYLENGSLASLLRREETAKELDWSKRLNVIKGVARALYYLHYDCSPPIVHRDISSNNVLLDSKCEAHVSDFGTAKLLKTDSSNWSKIAGTYGYIAPELAYMMKITEKCDVYSFGVLSMEVIKGEHPGGIIESLLSIQTEEKIVLKHILDQRLPPPSLADVYELKVILDVAIQCMHSDPKHRPTMQMISQRLLTRFGFQDPLPHHCLD